MKTYLKVLITVLTLSATFNCFADDKKMSVVITDVGINNSLAEKYRLERKVISVNLSAEQARANGRAYTAGNVHGGLTTVANSGTSAYGDGNSSQNSNSAAVVNADANLTSSLGANAKSSMIFVSYILKTTEGASLLRLRDMLARNIESSLSDAGFEASRVRMELNEKDAEVSDLAKTFPRSNYVISVFIGDFIDRSMGGRYIDKRTFSITSFIKVFDLKKNTSFTIKSEVDVNDTSTERNIRRSGDAFGDELIAESSKKISEEIATKLKDVILKPLVVNVKGNNIYVNRQLKIGQIIKVFREGERITDPTTGEFLGQENEDVGTFRVVKTFGKLSVCTPNIQPKIQPKISDTFTIVETTYGESGTKREIAKHNDNKELREKLAMSFDDYNLAKSKIAEGKRKIRESAPLENAQDFIAAEGTTMAKHVSASNVRENGRVMRREGERMVAQGEEILENIDKLKSQVRQSCEKMALTSADGRSLVCIVLKYELGRVIVLVNDKLYSIKESSLSEESKLRVQSIDN